MSYFGPYECMDMHCFNSKEEHSFPGEYRRAADQDLIDARQDERIAKLEQGGAVSDDKLAAAIAAYLEEHPIDAGLDEAALAEYLTENGYLTDAALADAIAQALADAKSSGEFNGDPGLDGADGGYYTPSVDADGNLTWTPSAENMPAVAGANIKGPQGDTGAQGPKGDKGDTGAQGSAGANGQDGTPGKSAYQYAVDGGYTGTEEAFAEKLAAEFPTALPSPNALTFTGAVSGSYDGSVPLEVAIPSGGGGSGKAKTEKLIDVTFEEATAMVSVTLEHNFHRLYLVWDCGSNGVARIVDTDGNAASGALCLCLDSTSAGWNERKIGQIDTDTKTWKSDALLSDWTDDVSTFIGAYRYSIATGTPAGISHCFGGTTAMAGTLGNSGLTPTAGRTLNVFTKAGLFAATTRIVLVGEYYG